jgi:flagellar motor switch protein FliG
VSQAGGVFLNGKGQIIEMFKLLTHEEKERLLKVIKARNPQLAGELVQETLTFDSLESIGERELLLLFNRIKPAVWGLALKGTKKSFQHKVLSAAPRDYAEKAYEVMMAPVDNERLNNQRAQKKVIEILASLKKNNLV